MKCIVCYLSYADSQKPLEVNAVTIVNGHSVCQDHIPAARKSVAINVVMKRRASQRQFGMDVQ